MALDLDIWTVDKLSGYFGGRPDVANVTLREAIDKYTGEKLMETVEYAKANSPFYREKIGEAAFADIPFTTPDELKEREKEFLCVSPSQISRIVTLQTSGTTGKPKRIYFTEEDQQLTVDYFNHGMRLIIDETDKVLILMAASSEGSVGRLLGKGIREMGAKTIEYGLLDRNDSEKILKLIRDEGVTSIVALPTHMIALARQAEKEAASGKGESFLRSVLLSGEFIPDNTAILLENVFGCMVFEHYGMTEMGLGCAVACGYNRGYHIRETDLYIELINPLTGEVVPERDGKNTPGFSNYGEIVFTTLTRKGMPFIRYRTGDFSRWILGDCPCGSSLKMLDKVVPGDGRMEERNGR